MTVAAPIETELFRFVPDGALLAGVSLWVYVDERPLGCVRQRPSIEDPLPLFDAWDLEGERSGPYMDREAAAQSLWGLAK
jgi:hypothetical protein